MDSFNLNEIIASLAVIIAGIGTVFGAMKFSRIRAAIQAFLTETPHSLKEAIDNLSSVVEAQGESIEWLRSELSIKNAELEKLRSQLVATQGLVEENAILRKRVGELETEVKALKDELDRRRKYTPKKYRSSSE